MRMKHVHHANRPTISPSTTHYHSHIISPAVYHCLYISSTNGLSRQAVCPGVQGRVSVLSGRRQQQRGGGGRLTRGRVQPPATTRSHGRQDHPLPPPPPPRVQHHMVARKYNPPDASGGIITTGANRNAEINH